MGSVLSATLPLGDDSIARAVAAAARPSVQSTVTRAPDLFPTLDVKQFVAYSTNLALWPAQAAETFSKYGVKSEAARAALDEHWRTRFTSEPELWVEFQQARADYLGWLRASWR